MEIDELLEMLEIEDPHDFNYFEQYAELAECEDDIPEDTLIQFFADVDKDNLEELTGNYFEEILNSVPEDAVDFYSTLVGIGQALTATAQAFDSDENKILYAEMFYKFRTWMVFDAEVQCVNVSSGEEKTVSILHAFSMYRAQNLSEEEYTYDFDSVLEYPIDEYSISISGFDAEDDNSEAYDDIDEE